MIRGLYALDGEASQTFTAVTTQCGHRLPGHAAAATVAALHSSIPKRINRTSGSTTPAMVQWSTSDAHPGLVRCDRCAGSIADFDQRLWDGFRIDNAGMVHCADGQRTSVERGAGLIPQFVTGGSSCKVRTIADPHLSTLPWPTGYFGKVGMRHYHLTRNSTHRPVINLDKLWTLVPAETRKGLTSSSTEVPVIDTLAAGYGKVLGKGRLPQLPVIVKARWVSELAEKKIKEAGGVVKLVA